MNKYKLKEGSGSGESTFSSDESVWEATMSDAPVFGAFAVTSSSNESAPSSKDDHSDEGRERAKVTPLIELTPEQRRRMIKQSINPDMPGRLVVKVAKDEATGSYETVDDYDDRPTRSLKASEMHGDLSKIGTSLSEAQEVGADAASTSEEMNDTQKELMQAKVEAMKKEMEAIEKALGDEGKSPEKLKEERKQKFGKAALKVFAKTAEIIGGAAAGAAIPMLVNAIAGAF